MLRPGYTSIAGLAPRPSSCFDFVLPYWHAVELHSVPIALPSKTAEEAKMRCKKTGY